MPGSMYGMRLGLPTAFWSSSWRSTIGCRERWPNRIASAMTSSGRRLAPASTIMIASRVPATIRSSSDSLSCVKVGLTTNSPSIRPTRTEPMGPLNGISLIVSAAEAAIVPMTSGQVLLVRREDGDHELDVVLVALGEERPDRPVRLAGGEDRVLRRTGLALDEAAGDLARRVHPLLEVDGEREEVEAGSRLRTVGGAEHHGVAVPDGDGAAGEPRELAGLDGQRATTELRLECLRHGDGFLLGRGGGGDLRLCGRLGGRASDAEGPRDRPGVHGGDS